MIMLSSGHVKGSYELMVALTINLVMVRHLFVNCIYRYFLASENGLASR